MAARPRRLRRGGPGAVTLVTALVVVVTLVAAVWGQHVAVHHDLVAERARAEVDAARLEAELDAVVADAGIIAAGATGGPGPFTIAATRGLDHGPAQAFLLVGARHRELRKVVARGALEAELTGLRRSPGVVAAVDSAVAHAEPRLAAPVELGSVAVVVTVHPVVPAGAAADIASRRAAADAAVLGVVPLEQLRRPSRGPALWPHSPVRITTASGVIGPAVPQPIVGPTVLAAGAVWRVEVGRPAGGGRIVGWAILVAGLLAAAAVQYLLGQQQRQRYLAEDEVSLRSRQLELIAETSSALQQSLNVADLLPTFCVSVADEFDLRGVAVLLADEQGHATEAFRIGGPGPADSTERLELQRGWRTVGRIEVTSAEPLDPVTLQSLQALADLLGIAVTNAQLFQREQHAVTRLSELDALKNAFLGTVSHELRTSTTAVLGFSELLDHHWDTLADDRRQELVRRVHRQAGSLRHLVDDLLDYARLEHKSLRVSPRLVSLRDLVEELTDTMAPLVADHDVVVDAPEDVTAWADPIAVERILANLLSNAGKYSPPGSTVTVRVARIDGRARLQVADQGPGIPLDERRRVFVRFYRLSNAETVRTRGAGIGLSILHDFADRSDATVTIGDAPGGGAVISVDFPAEAPPPGSETVTTS